jgi:hypothetical protein
MTVRTIIFAKAPQPGFAKTRLIPALGAEGAAELARRMLNRTLAAAVDAGLGLIEVCVGPSPSDAAWAGFVFPPDVEITAQVDGDIGRRMAHAAQLALKSGPVLLIGTDWAEVSAARLREASAALCDHDAALYPAHDGGYVLLGLTRYAPALFHGIPWSTDAVAALTHERLAVLGWRCWLGALQHDVDDPDDLRHLPSHLFHDLLRAQ